MKKMMMMFIVLFLSCFLATAAAENNQAKGRAINSESAAIVTNGLLKKVNMAQGTLIIQHEAIKNLDMPSMTMLFSVKDPSLMAGLKAGDHVQFQAIDNKGALTVTWIRVK